MPFSLKQNTKNGFSTRRGGSSGLPTSGHSRQAPSRPPVMATPDLNRCHNSKRARKWETQKASQSRTAGVRVRVTDLSGPQTSGVCCTSPHTHLNTHLPAGAHTHHIYKTSQQEISPILKWPGLNKMPLTEFSELLDCIKWRRKANGRVGCSTMNSLLRGTGSRGHSGLLRRGGGEGSGLGQGRGGSRPIPGPPHRPSHPGAIIGW